MNKNRFLVSHNRKTAIEMTGAHLWISPTYDVSYRADHYKPKFFIIECEGAGGVRSTMAGFETIENAIVALDAILVWVRGQIGGIYYSESDQTFSDAVAASERSQP